MAVNYGYFATPYGAVTPGGMPYTGGAFPMAQPAYSQLPASFGAMIQGGMPFLGSTAMPQAFGAMPMGYNPMMQGAAMPYLSPNVMMGAQAYNPMSAGYLPMQGAMPYAGAAMPGTQMPFGQPGMQGTTPGGMPQPFQGALQNFGEFNVNNYFGGLPNANTAQPMLPQQTGQINPYPQAQQQPPGNDPNAQVAPQVMALLSQVLNMMKDMLGALMPQQQNMPSFPGGGQFPQTGPSDCGNGNPGMSRRGRCRGGKRSGRHQSQGKHRFWGKHKAQGKTNTHGIQKGRG